MLLRDEIPRMEALLPTFGLSLKAYLSQCSSLRKWALKLVFLWCQICARFLYKFTDTRVGFVVFLWAAWEACRYTIAISGDQTLLAFKIAFLCMNCENFLQGFTSNQTCKQHASCWAVRVIYCQVKGRCFLEPLMFEQSNSAPRED